MKHIKIKKIVTTFMALAILLMSCKDNKEKKGDSPNQEENIVVQEDDVTDGMLYPSDLGFSAALEEYQAGNYAKASEYIENGVIELREEEKPTEKLDRLLLDENIDKIRGLEENVRTNQVEEINVLAHAIANAEMLVAHDYIVYTISSLSEEPVRGTYYFNKALRSLDKAILNLKGNSKEEAKKISDESNLLSGKIKAGSKDLDSDLKKQTKKIADFFKKHQTILL